jgi:signal transduction histidine kinase
MDRIESSTRSIQDFSSDISHELRTPLAIIRGEIELALRRERSTETLVQTLHVIEEEVNELIRLVDDLMLLVRSDARQLKFEKKAVSLKNVLGSVCDRFQERAQRKKVSLTTNLEDDVWMDGDELYLKRLFSNLVDNALKFTPENGKVVLTLRRDERNAHVEVVDTGMGIELEVQGKVFSRFYRAAQARSHEGSGLGLNIAKAICDGHSGRISLQSFPQQGTRVSVDFPCL